MVRHSGGNVNPDCSVMKAPVKDTEQQNSRNEFKNITCDIVPKTNDVLLLKTLSEHGQYTKRSKDLLDEEMVEMRHGLQSLKLSHSDIVTPKVIVAAPVTEGTSPLDRFICLNKPLTHQNKWKVVDGYLTLEVNLS